MFDNLYVIHIDNNSYVYLEYNVFILLVFIRMCDFSLTLVMLKTILNIFEVKIFSTGGIYSHVNVHHSYSKELSLSWSCSVWLFCLDITYGQSQRDTYSIMSLSDWTMGTWSAICVHGLNMTRCIEQYKSQLQADHDLAFCDRFIRHRSLASALTATCPLFPCISVGHACRQCWYVCDSTMQKM